jgi:CarD family transcriptional regulator
MATKKTTSTSKAAPAKKPAAAAKRTTSTSKAAPAKKPAAAAKKPAAATRKPAATKPATAAKKTASTSKAAPAKKPAAAAKKPATATRKPAAKKTATTAGKATAAARKPAAGKPAAATKKTSAAGSPAKTRAAVKPAAKPAAKKPSSAARAKAKTAPAPKATAAGRKPADQKTPAPETTAPAARSRKAPAFSIGDKVVHPHHGAAIIVKKVKQTVAGNRQDYYQLEIATDQLTVLLPVANIEDTIRPVISKNQARKVFASFKEPPQEAGSNWSRWYKVLNEKMTSGDIYQVAEVVRDLTYSQQTKGISPALKRMLSKARLTLTSELRFALNVDEEEATRKLDRALPKVEAPEET